MIKKKDTMKNMNDLNSYLFSMNVEDLKNTTDLIRDIIESKIKSSLKVNDEVYIVQKSKKDEGIVEKINKSRALVKIGHTSYHVPFTMIEIKTK